MPCQYVLTWKPCCPAILNKTFDCAGSDMLPLGVQSGGLKAFARSWSREISLKDGSIRDLTCALIISWVPLQISLSNKQTANHDSVPLLTGSCFTTTTNTHIPHYTPRLCSHWSKTPFLITAAPICLATIEKTGREELTVRLEGSISGHKYEYSVMLFLFIFCSETSFHPPSLYLNCCIITWTKKKKKSYKIKFSIHIWIFNFHTCKHEFYMSALNDVICELVVWIFHIQICQLHAVRPCIQ